jgi:hypothetical protein
MTACYLDTDTRPSPTVGTSETEVQPLVSVNGSKVTTGVLRGLLVGLSSGTADTVRVRVYSNKFKSLQIYGADFAFSDTGEYLGDEGFEIPFFEDLHFTAEAGSSTDIVLSLTPRVERLGTAR